MNNQNEIDPWEEIPLTDYENHMRLKSVQQLQILNKMMRRQFSLCDADTVMVLGIAGGNGLEHIVECGFRQVFGVDINSMQAIGYRLIDKMEEPLPNGKELVEMHYIFSDDPHRDIDLRWRMAYS